MLCTLLVVPPTIKGMGRAKSIGGQLFCLPDDRYRVAEVVQRLHAVDIHAHTLLAQKSGQLRIAAAPLVAGHIKKAPPASAGTAPTPRK